ncbi:1-deoxy-D-xylulose-5-phosphate reductoisomerase [Futiania mangrovi]|uniref:1-deoxy-D-xylulose 5-phosphate reductoisomerase n=1 Tax=Futiania mangrovi TaxID=2959716 RepID=A0A9J6P899_9PROT|nr:1-deoxy-D-xylulose-5-phosphate reductoisomerase [Futiania mangrovii]MCP1335820.1 1-deoxy-D-xylulose-5-phosphate reductoisomerase [Futiania mangrovii]
MAVSHAKSPQPASVRRISIFGVTGSIGGSTVDLVRRAGLAGSGGRFLVEAVSAHRNVAALAEAARALQARVAVIAEEGLLDDLRAALSGSGVEAAAGEAALVEAASRPADWVMAAIVGAAGLKPTLAAVRQGAVVALANKECLVSAGPVFMDAVQRAGATLLPVDSEHNAIFQVLAGARMSDVERITLTASGGPFRTWDIAAMRAATPAQAIAHPNWSMGAKISVDSATMMNKGLELIEAAHLFPVGEACIDVLVHPQSVVHSLVAFRDGSVLAQLGTPDMRTPIAHTLAWPDRMETPCARLDLARVGRLDFEAPDDTRFPALRLAREALRAEGVAPTVLNAANEVCVARFLAGEIGFLDIPAGVERVLEAVVGEAAGAVPGSLEDVMHWDARARHLAQGFAAA